MMLGELQKSGTVKVTDMMRVERYSHVMHMVSDVEATIQEDKDAFDLFRATFTAGTMTGAPKIRAMELIAEYEKLREASTLEVLVISHLLGIGCSIYHLEQAL